MEGGRGSLLEKKLLGVCPSEPSLREGDPWVTLYVDAQGTWGALGPNYTVDMTTGVLSVL
jgi:hypothetical protein